MRARDPARWLAVLVTSVLASPPSWGEPAQGRPVHRFRERHPRIIIRPFSRPLRPGRPAPPLLIEPPGQFMPPDLSRPSGSAPLPSAPVSSGFHITLPLGTPTSASRLDQAYDVAKALSACWTSPTGLSWTIATVRLSFKSDGSVNGQPRVVYSDAGSAQGKRDLADSLLAALKRCTPLPFSPSLGAAIAGRLFAISFTHKDPP